MNSHEFPHQFLRLACLPFHHNGKILKSQFATSNTTHRTMAERQGFEPWAGFYPDSRLAGGRLKPLGHLSKTYFSKWRRGWDSNPRTFLGADCFRDSSNQPDSATPPYFVSKFGSNISLVPKAGLEPARVSPHAPQTCVSTIPPLRRFSLLFYSVYGPVDRIRTCTP